MPIFSSTSQKQLATCDKRLQKLANAVIGYIDFQVIEGFRNKKDQDIAFAKGKSEKRWPYGKHNKLPSMAMDIAPWPVDWRDEDKAIQRFVLLAGFMLCKAKDLGIKLRWGGDWNQNLDTRDERFRDYGHFEVLD